MMFYEDRSLNSYAQILYIAITIHTRNHHPSLAQSHGSMFVYNKGGIPISVIDKEIKYRSGWMYLTIEN